MAQLQQGGDSRRAQERMNRLKRKRDELRDALVVLTSDNSYAGIWTMRHIEDAHHMNPGGHNRRITQPPCDRSTSDPVGTPYYL